MSKFRFSLDSRQSFHFKTFYNVNQANECFLNGVCVYVMIECILSVAIFWIAYGIKKVLTLVTLSFEKKVVVLNVIIVENVIDGSCDCGSIVDIIVS